MEAARLREMIEKGIPGAQVDAVDLKGTGDHFEVTVVSDRFEGCSAVERHRMVYAALGDAMQGEIHALMIEALSPSQYKEGLITEIGKAPRS